MVWAGHLQASLAFGFFFFLGFFFVYKYTILGSSTIFFKKNRETRAEKSFIFSTFLKDQEDFISVSFGIVLDSFFLLVYLLSISRAIPNTFWQENKEGKSFCC